MAEQTGVIGAVKAAARKVSGAAAGRVSWPLSDDGRRLKGGSAEKVREQIRNVLQATLDDPAAVAELGIQLPAAPAASPGAQPGGLDSDKLAGLLLEFCSVAGIRLAQRAGYSEKTSRLAALTADEAKAIQPAAAAVLDKYMPANLGKYEAEIALCVAIGGVIAGKVQLLREAAKQERPAQPAGAGVVSGNFGAVAESQ